MTADAVAAALEDAEEFTPLDERLAVLPRNDIGNARRLLARFGDDDLIYVRDIGWYSWTGTHWSQPLGDRDAQLAAQKTAQAMRGEAAALQAAGPLVDRESGGAEAQKDFDKRVAAAYGWAVRSGDRNRLSAMLTEAAPHRQRAVGDMDVDRLKLSVANGTLTLGEELVGGDVVATVGFESHRRADLITHIGPVAYDAKAVCPEWQAFLARILPDAAVRAFLQRWFGYCLTGLTDEECLVIMFGNGANGKGTLVEVLMRMLGGHTAVIPIASLMQDDRRRGSEANPDIARLPAVRLVVANEPEATHRFSEGLVKALTGGDTLTARHLNKGFFEFEPTHKILVSTNKRPTVRGQDEGIWRRLLLVPFDVQIPKGERVGKTVLLRRFLAEGPGILNWLLKGYRDWREGGLAIPDAVRAATDAYRDESDPVGQFFAASVIRVAGKTATARALYQAYGRWCTANAQRPVSQTAFGRIMVDRGWHREKAGVMYYQDCELVRDYAEHGAPDAEDGDPGPGGDFAGAD